MSTKSLTKENVFDIVEQFGQFVQEQRQPAAVERLQPVLRQYQDGIFQLVVVGEIKKGKSSFVNALLGEPGLLPADSDVATSTVFKIIYGAQRKYEVLFYPTDPENPIESTPPALEVSREQLAEYGTEKLNPDNKKGVDFIQVQLPHPWLKAGLVIVDTPGLGGLFREHSEITWRYIPAADAIFFVLDSQEAVASKAEMDYLQRLRKLTSVLFFVQTKIDLVDETQWKGWRERNLEIISQALDIPIEKLFYFAVSSTLKECADQEHSSKDLERSGFGRLLQFIRHQLLRTKEERLAQMVLRGVMLEAGAIRQQIADELQMVNTETKEEMKKLQAQLKKSQGQFTEWRTKEYPRLIRAFQQNSGDLKVECLNDLQNRLDMSPFGSVIAPIIKAFRENKCGSKQILNGMPAINSDCHDRCMQISFDILNTYCGQMNKLTADVAEKMGQPWEGYRGLVFPKPLDPRIDPPPVPGRLIGKLRNFWMDFTLGSALGTLLSFATVALFPPSAAPMLIAGLSVGGGALTAYHGNKGLNIRNKEEALIRLQNLLVATVQSVLKQATQLFNKTARDFERSAADTFEKAVEAMEQELKVRSAAINGAIERTQHDNQLKAVELTKTIAQADRLLREIQQLAGTDSKATA